MLVSASASAQPSRQSILVRVEGGFVTTGCDVGTFKSAGTALPHVGGTLCAVGGPFGAGMTATAQSAVPKFAGNSGTIQLDRTFTFSDPKDTITVRTIFNFTDKIFAGSGGLNYFNGTWSITGGTGLFTGLKGQGTLTNAIGSTTDVPPPPQFTHEEWVGWVQH
jgi:hypothetical protein